jgi:hypothetical protein
VFVVDTNLSNGNHEPGFKIEVKIIGLLATFN